MKHPLRLTLAIALMAAAVPSLALSALPPCGRPTNGAAPRASDALYVLKATVQSTDCDIRVCDVTDTNTVTASDALMILKGAVGQEVNFNCPG